MATHVGRLKEKGKTGTTFLFTKGIMHNIGPVYISFANIAGDDIAVLKIYKYVYGTKRRME